MNFFVKKYDGTWGKIKTIFVKGYNGNWSKAKTIFVKGYDGHWSKFYTAIAGPEINTKVTISKTTGADDLITLKGTNQTWTSTATITSESYKFKRSIDGGSTYDFTISSGSATNNSQYTKKLIDTDPILYTSPYHVEADVENYFIFEVSATDSYGTTYSESDPIIIYGAETPTTSIVSAGTNSVTITWSSSPHANVYTIEYKKSSDTSWSMWKPSFINFSSGPATISYLDSDTDYDFRVTAWTGSGDTDGYGTGYSSNPSAKATTKTLLPDKPEQLTRPYLDISTAYPFYPVNGHSGTYKSGTYTSKSTYIAKTTDTTVPTDGAETDVLTYVGSPPYTATQLDATSPTSIFYYVDAVVSYDGTKTFYYYSDPVDTQVASTLSDDFNRSVSNGVGYLTPDYDGGYNPTQYNAYRYNLVGVSSAWDVNGSRAVSTAVVSGTNPNTYPLAAIELSGKTNLNMSVDLPAGPDGLGLVFWATSTGSWWASSLHRATRAVTKTEYYLTSTSCDVETSEYDPAWCNFMNVVEPVCTPGAGTINSNCGYTDSACIYDNDMGDQISHCKTRIVYDLCPPNNAGSEFGNYCGIRFDPICPQNGTGTSGTHCGTARTVTTCPDNASGDYITHCKIRTVSNYYCLDNNGGNFYSNCKTRTVYTCPNNAGGSSGSYCKTRTVTTCPANGIGSNINHCNIRSSSSCPNNAGGSSGSYCKTRISSSCPANGTGSSISNCGIRTSQRCQTGCSSGGNGYCYSNSYPYALCGAIITTTSYDSAVYGTIYDSAVATTIYDGAVDTTVYDSTSSSTAYDAPSDATFYDLGYDATVYDSQEYLTYYDAAEASTHYDQTVRTYSGNVDTTVTHYYRYGCGDGPYVTYDGTVDPLACSSTTSSIDVYDTTIRILSANGSSVTTRASANVLLDEETPSNINKISVTTSGNIISAKAYEGNAQVGNTATYNASGATKKSSNGYTAAGIIKTPPGISGGVYFDNLNISST